MLCLNFSNCFVVLHAKFFQKLVLKNAENEASKVSEIQNYATVRFLARSALGYIHLQCLFVEIGVTLNHFIGSSTITSRVNRTFLVGRLDGTFVNLKAKI